MCQENFKRYEIKYILNTEQKDSLKKLMEKYMTTNKYSFSTIRNIYFDTERYQLIRNSLEKPIYKEKLRIRSYKTVNPDENVFVEIKKKYDSIVYKRRLTMSEQDAMRWIIEGNTQRPKTQIGNEIEYFCQHYQGLNPAVFLSYDREAYQGITDKEFRMTFDTNILVRREDMRLISEPYGVDILGQGNHILEIKTAGSIPLWLVHFLSENKIYKTSFSKYGTAYQQMILPEIIEQKKIHHAQHFAEKQEGMITNDKLIQWAF